MTTASPPYSQPIRRTALAARKPTRFSLTPSPDELAAIAGWLGLIALPALSFTGEIRPVGRTDFRLEGRLAARVVQPSVVTLAPVESLIDEDVRRTFLADWHEPEEDESEVPEDDTVEPLGEAIDPGAVMIEALSLALPLYPRAPGEGFDGQIAAAPDAEPLTDEKLRPFADLAAMMKAKGDKNDAS